MRNIGQYCFYMTLALYETVVRRRCR